MKNLNFYVFFIFLTACSNILNNPVNMIQRYNGDENDNHSNNFHTIRINDNNNIDINKFYNSNTSIPKINNSTQYFLDNGNLKYDIDKILLKNQLSTLVDLKNTNSPMNPRFEEKLNKIHNIKAYLEDRVSLPYEIAKDCSIKRRTNSHFENINYENKKDYDESSCFEKGSLINLAEEIELIKEKAKDCSVEMETNEYISENKDKEIYDESTSDEKERFVNFEEIINSQGRDTIEKHKYDIKSEQNDKSQQITNIKRENFKNKLCKQIKKNSLLWNSLTNQILKNNNFNNTNLIYCKYFMHKHKFWNIEKKDYVLMQVQNSKIFWNTYSESELTFSNLIDKICNISTGGVILPNHKFLHNETLLNYLVKETADFIFIKRKEILQLKEKKEKKMSELNGNIEDLNKRLNFIDKELKQQKPKIKKIVKKAQKTIAQLEKGVENLKKAIEYRRHQIRREKIKLLILLLIATTFTYSLYLNFKRWSENKKVLNKHK